MNATIEFEGGTAGGRPGLRRKGRGFTMKAHNALSADNGQMSRHTEIFGQNKAKTCSLMAKKKLAHNQKERC